MSADSANDDASRTESGRTESPGARASRLREWLGGAGIVALLAYMLWPHPRRPFDSRAWKAHEDRDAMVVDLEQRFRAGAIFDQTSAEAHLGKPDRREQYRDGNGTAWWCYVDSGGRRYLRADFDVRGSLTDHRTGPPADD